MKLVILILSLITMAQAATVNVQPIIENDSISLKVIYFSSNSIKLIAKNAHQTHDYSLEASSELKEVTLKLPQQKLEDLKIEVFEGHKKLSFPDLYLALPVKKSPQKILNSIGSAKNGKWIISKGVYHIKGHHQISFDKILVEAGSQFLFQSNSSLVFKGVTRLEGLKNSEIIFKGAHKEANYFIHMEQSEGKTTYLSYVKIHDNAHSLHHLPTGTLTLYGGNFVINHLSLSHLQSEDALNIINCSAQIEDSEFKDLSSDGIDCDFCQLQARNLNFREIQGDGIDLSGATLSAHKIDMTHVMDKGFSIGENSRAELTKISVTKSEVGAAVKDASLAKIKDYDFRETKIPLSLYTKKSWFPTPPELYLSPAYPDKKKLQIKDGAILVEESL